MFLRKYRIFIFVTFLSIFLAKMIISGAPVFFTHIDKNIMNSVIMQIEHEHSSDGDSGKTGIKFTDYKLIEFYHVDSFETILSHFGISNSFIDHFKRYVDPFHPTVPTPPPNFC
ncbi:hypothetical protein [Pedobacter metabolipauper]|uniref:Uncharacterized protein n=1 Tax=Pedobacter metabolipauper TaxID=425513 RepID=A0A4R6SSK6_9SPHI|nr:hypothetical protein [Pedobacter metabolipauper]TDQ07571.1 hypothetical protein ATK78_3698 [Pedobacter metabolipauper]